MSKMNRLFGTFFIFAGLYLLLERLRLIDGDIFLLLLGSTFLAIYFATNRPLGLLIPGSIITWLGLYALLMENNYWPIIEKYEGGLLFLALGLAFCTIFFHTYFSKQKNYGYRFWPLMPGFGLIIFAFIVEVEFSFIPYNYLFYIETYWPVLIIIVGIIFLASSYKKRRESK
ncbi:MAG: hypothetical protein KAX49_12225 [Halanaerobiales bacterium]|nr:hypothetical protein [Halanaerobiales bacterium]